MIGLFDANGNTVVQYVYNSWGLPVSTTGTKASTVGAINPFRYRGYVYDTESGLYYLQSRYYNPEWGRFVNADEYASTGQGQQGHNMFAYCANNPVNLSDPTGEFALPLLATIVTVAAITITAMIVISYIANTPSAQQGFEGLGRAIVDGLAGVGDELKVLLTSLTTTFPLPVPTANPTVTQKTNSKSTAKSQTKSQTKTADITKAPPKESYRYWEASRAHGKVVIGNGLTYESAKFRVALGGDVMCINQISAFAIVLGNGYVNATIPERHGEEGYYWHYHPNRNSHVHIWYYS